MSQMLNSSTLDSFFREMLGEVLEKTSERWDNCPYTKYGNGFCSRYIVVSRVDSNLPVHTTHPLQQVNLEEMDWEEEKKGFFVSMAGQVKFFGYP